MNILQQVHISDNLLLFFSLPILFSVNMYLDVITHAIYRAYDDKADISEYSLF